MKYAEKLAKVLVQDIANGDLTEDEAVKIGRAILTALADRSDQKTAK